MGTATARILFEELFAYCQDDDAHCSGAHCSRWLEQTEEHRETDIVKALAVWISSCASAETCIPLEAEKS